ncbi:uncharacterized protein [Miscanthus floridulus]|uniref:uncharacterized protein n=1 Tax=Miscanthus floridulus TaxID=154761 RepID=UPI00345A63AE
MPRNNSRSPRRRRSWSPPGGHSGGGGGDDRGLVLHRTVKELGNNAGWPMLTRTNYTDWAALMRVMLQGRHLWDAINVSTNSFTDDRNALETLCKAVPEELRGTMANKPTAKAAWDALKTRHIGVDRITDQLAILGDAYEEETIIRKFLQAVPDRFHQIAVAIETLLDLEAVSLEELLGRLRNGSIVGEEKAAEAQVAAAEKRECRKKKRDEAAAQANQPQANLVKAEEEMASLYMAVVIPAEKVIHRIGPVEHVFLNERKVMPDMEDGGDHGELKWYLDTGASNHMTGDASIFSELSHSVIGSVKFGDGSLVEIAGRGTILFESKDGGHQAFHDVYYIPRLCRSILSIGQLDVQATRSTSTTACSGCGTRGARSCWPR